MDFIQKMVAGRSVLRWSQQDLADHSGLSISSIAKIEMGSGTTSKSQAAIEHAFLRHNIAFSQNGIESRSITSRIFKDYIEVLDDIMLSLHPDEEYLVHCCDNGLSPETVRQKLQQLKEYGLKFRATCPSSASVFQFDKHHYRLLSLDHIKESDVWLIYADRVVIGVGNQELLGITNRYLANVMRKQFEFFWGLGSMPE
jgi:hypothetical protein